MCVIKIAVCVHVCFLLESSHSSWGKGTTLRSMFCLRQYYNLWLSLLGGVMCTAIMFLIQWWTGLLTVAIIIILYLVVAHRKPGQC